jgi:hypothetical protein
LPSDRDALLDRVYARANRLWWQRRALPAGAAALVLLTAVAVVPRVTDDGPHHLRVATGGVAQESTTTALPTTTVTAGATSTTRDPCYESHDPACGPRRWDPRPRPNQPLQATVTYTPVEPKVGDEVVFTVHAVDPDASDITRENCQTRGQLRDYDMWGDRVSVSGPCIADCTDPTDFGRWPPPRRIRGEKTFEYRHTYASAGTFTATFFAASAFGADALGTCSSGEPHPYASRAMPTTTVIVTGEPATTTAPPAATSGTP